MATTEGNEMRSRFLGLAVAAGLLAMIAAGSAGAATASIWTVVPSVNPQASQVTDTSFAAVSAISATSGWAVGTFMNASALENPLVEHWNGSRWTLGSAPEPSGTQAGLSGVDQLSKTSAWAVGTTATKVAGEGNIDNEPLIEHWNGTRWSIVPGAVLPAGATGDLTAVGGTGPGDVWAVGFTLSADAQEQVLFEHYDGKSWSQAPFPTQTSACSPDASDCFLDPEAVAASAASNVWVVGTVREPNPTANFIAHWNGKAWSVVPAPCLTGQIVESTCALTSADLNQLSGVTVLSAKDAWASGSEGNVNDQNFRVPYVLHWNGTKWALVKTPNLGGEGSMLNGITALGSRDIWAVGQTQQLNGAIAPLTEQFTGSAWKVVTSPVTGSKGRIPDDSLDGVTSPGHGLLLAVGARDIPGQCCLRSLGLKTTHG